MLCKPVEFSTKTLQTKSDDNTKKRGNKTQALTQQANVELQYSRATAKARG